MPLAVAPPVFVTVRVTRKFRPVQTGPAGRDTAAASHAPAWTRTVLDPAAFEITGHPAFPSAAVTVVVQVTIPGMFAVKVQVNVSAAPPARSTGTAGNGPSAQVAVPPVPPKTNGRNPSPAAVASPLFVTVSVSTTGPPDDTDHGAARSRAESSGGVCTVVAAPPDALTTVAPHVVPAAVAVKVTAPVAVAE